jgi:hypothetical protein
MAADEPTAAAAGDRRRIIGCTAVACQSGSITMDQLPSQAARH